MGVADSPLRDRVVFVEGAPRSGTTLLAALLACHPEIAGILSESHLFERGVRQLFDSHEGAGGWKPHLAAYLEREELVDLVRDLCDSIFERMRTETKPEARFVLEKTPAVRERARVSLTRKLECYPDGWYVHIVRESDAVVRSLMRAPWNPDRSEAGSERWRREGVEAIREVFGGQPRYREIRFEELTEDPGGVVAELYEWLGLGVDGDVVERVRALARQRFSDMGPVEEDRKPVWSRPRVAAETRQSPPAAGPRAGLRRSPLLAPLRRFVAAIRARRPREVASAFARAFRERDAAKLRALTTDSVEFTLRSGDGDLEAAGESAREAMLEVGRKLFDTRFLSEWWTVSDGKPLATIVFAAVRPDGTRMDIAWTIAVESARVTGVTLIAAGGLGGRPLRQWSQHPPR